MKVSIIMSVYNEEISLIEKSISSILRQSHENFEFIIVFDNPNNEEIFKYLSNIKKKDKRILLLKNNKNIGLSKSLNKAILFSSGEYIFRMDADDISEYNRISEQLKFMIDNKLDISSTLIKSIDTNDKVIYTEKFYRENLLDKKLKKIIKYRSLMAHPSWCVKKETYLKLGLYRDIVPVEDYDFILRASEININMGILNKHMLLYRNNINGISSNNKKKQKIMAIVLQKIYGNLNYTDLSIINDLYKILEFKYRNVNFEEYEFIKNNILQKKEVVKNLFYIVSNNIYINMFLKDVKIAIIKKFYF